MLKKLRIIIVLAILISGLGYYYYTCERPVQLPGEDAFSLGLVVADQSEAGDTADLKVSLCNQGQRDYSIASQRLFEVLVDGQQVETTGDAAHTWELARGGRIERSCTVPLSSDSSQRRQVVVNASFQVRSSLGERREYRYQVSGMVPAA